MGKFRCRWVRDRLPLLVGDELRGLDRRGVERHLIGCPQCRQHQASLGQALSALRSVATASPAPPDAPSLWPALARQIRESRRPAPSPAFAFGLPFSFAWPRANPWPALGLGLGLLATIGVGVGVRRQVATAQAQIVANRLPIARSFTVPGPRLVVAPAPPPTPRGDLPAPVDVPVVESTPPPRIDYDLDHGRPMSPMSPEARDPRDTKFTH